MEEKEVFQIIKIIDSYHLVINGGSSQDLSEGDEVEIFVKGEQLTDPFNDDKPLGTLDYIKAVLTIQDVYPKFSVCVHEIREKVEIPSPLASATFGFRKRHEYRYENIRLDVKDEEITGGYPEHDKRLLIGDTVRIRHV